MIKIQLNRVYLGYDDTFILPIIKLSENNFICIKNCSKNNKTQAQVYHYDGYGRCFGITWMDIKQYLPKHNSLYIQNKEMIQKMKNFCKDKDYKLLKAYIIIELENKICIEDNTPHTESTVLFKDLEKMESDDLFKTENE